MYSQHHKIQFNPQNLKTFLGHYSRQEALALGQLIDITPQAQRFAYLCPVAISQALYDQCVQWTRHDTDCQIYQDEDIRLSSLLTVVRTICKTTGFARAEATFNFPVLVRDGYSIQKTSKCLKILLDKGDQNQPALTITLADDLHQALLEFTDCFQTNVDEVG